MALRRGHRSGLIATTTAGPALVADVRPQAAARPWLAFPVRVTACVVVAFAAIVTGLAYHFGLPFTPPTERVSIVTGLNSGLPLATAIFGYLVAQSARRFFRRAGTDQDFARNVVTDFTMLAFFLAAFYLHFNLKMWIPLINEARYDEFYFSTDQALRPLIDRMVALRLAIAPPGPIIDHLYQQLFFVSFIAAFVFHAVGDRTYFYHYAFAVTTMLCVGGLTYLIAPAVGPFIYEDGVNARANDAQAGMWYAYQQVEAHGAAWIAANGSQYFTGPLAAMPSLHVANAFLNLYYISRARSILTPFFIVLASWIVLESVTSRWHYVIDAPAGLVVAFAVIALTNRIFDRRRFAGDL